MGEALPPLSAEFGSAYGDGLEGPWGVMCSSWPLGGGAMGGGICASDGNNQPSINQIKSIQSVT